MENDGKAGTLDVGVRVVSTYSAEGRSDEVFVTSEDPYINFKMNFDGALAGSLETGVYQLHFTKVADVKVGATEEAPATPTAKPTDPKQIDAPAKDLSKTPKPVV